VGAGLARAGTTELWCATSDGPTSEFWGRIGDRLAAEFHGGTGDGPTAEFWGHGEDRPVMSMMRTGRRQRGSPPL
jgi:hypothetical protein